MGMSRGKQDQGWAEAFLCILAGAHGTTPPRQISGKRAGCYYRVPYLRVVWECCIGRCRSRVLECI